MDIRNLYEKISAQIKDNTFRLSEKTTDIGAIGGLCQAFALEELVIEDITCILQEQELILNGRFTISSLYKEIEIDITMACSGLIRAVISAPQIGLDFAGFFIAENIKMTVELQDGKKDFYEKLEGELPFGGIPFRFSSVRKELQARRQLAVTYDKEIKVSELLASLLHLVQLDLSVFPIDLSKAFHITEIEYTYTADSRWFTAAMETEKYDDCLELSVVTDIGFLLYNSFGMKNIGFAVEKYGSEYEFSMKGEMELFGAELPFFICYHNELFSVSLSQCDKAQLKGIEDMGVLIGEKEIQKNFPADFEPTGSIVLHTMNFAVSSDFKNIQDFNVVVLLDYQWELCKSPQLIISDLLISFAYSMNTKNFALAGKIEFCGVNTGISAALILEEGKQTQWNFKWFLYEKETIGLTDFIGKLAKAFQVGATQIPLPEIAVGNVAVQYAAGTFEIQAHILVTRSKLFASETKIKVTSAIKNEKRDYKAEIAWKSSDKGLTIGNLLQECGAEEAAAELPEFLREIGILAVELSYDFLENKIISELEVNKIGKLGLELVFGANGHSTITFAPQISGFSVADIPVVGKMAEQFAISPKELAVSDIVMHILTVKDEKQQLPAGVSLTLQAMGKKEVIVLYEKKEAALLADQSSEPKIVWIGMDKTIAVLSLYRLGIGLDGPRFVAVLDAALNVTPLTFSLNGAGVGIDFSNPADFKGYLSGFAISFRNEICSIAGEFSKSEGDYTGVLLIQVKQISAFALAEYSEDGSFMAFAAVKACFGGPPALFVTGAAFGFGYHRRLILPEIDRVADYPLIEAAAGKITRADMAEKLKKYFAKEKGQKFLAAGINFTSFGMVDSCAILTVSFGNSFEIGLLGISEITIPPHCEKLPIAYAKLALLAAIKPEAGFFSVEARLTSESYLLSKSCKLTGGFALCCWFGGENSGDMVLSLGGYRSGYEKPKHYPEVPRVGFSWKIDEHLNVNGEMYFALTPKEIMAGGRLNATYTLGKLKAYFIAAVDFFMRWKPFHYEASAQILIGVSYRVDVWFVHHTFTVELGAGLSVWGPDFAGKAHISWFIISFDISFGKTNRQKEEGIGWEEFVQSFLPQKDKKTNSAIPAPVSITYAEGLLAEGETAICRADGLKLCVESAVPVTSFAVNHADACASEQEISIQPMNGARLTAHLSVELCDEQQQAVEITAVEIKKNLPAALWGKKEDTLVKNVVCGLYIQPIAPKYTLFPSIHYISLEQLYLNGTIRVSDAFSYREAGPFPHYTTEDSIRIFAETVDDGEVRKRRQEFFRKQGIDSPEISMEKYAANAENLFSEEIMVKG